MDIELNEMMMVMNWGGWTRTTNFLINSQAICQLIYAPSVWHSSFSSSYTQRRPPVADLAGVAVDSLTRALTRSPGGGPLIIVAIRVDETKHWCL